MVEKRLDSPTSRRTLTEIRMTVQHRGHHYAVSARRRPKDTTDGVDCLVPMAGINGSERQRLDVVDVRRQRSDTSVRSRRSDQRFLASTPRQIAEVNKKNGSSTDNWDGDDCDHVSINGGVDPKRCDRDIEDINDDSASLVDDGWRPTKSCRLDANAPISSMCVAYPVLLECGPCHRQIGQSWRPTAVCVAAAGARPGQSCAGGPAMPAGGGPAAFWTAVDDQQVGQRRL